MLQKAFCNFYHLRYDFPGPVNIKKKIAPEPKSQNPDFIYLMFIIFLKMFSSTSDQSRVAPSMTDTRDTCLCAARTNRILRGRPGWAAAVLFHNVALVVFIVGGQRLTKGQEESKPPALAARGGNVGKRAIE